MKKELTGNYLIDQWYDRHTRSWVTQVLDREGNQVGDAQYCTASGKVDAARTALAIARNLTQAAKDAAIIAKAEAEWPELITRFVVRHSPEWKLVSATGTVVPLGRATSCVNCYMGDVVNGYSLSEETRNAILRGALVVHQTPHIAGVTVEVEGSEYMVLARNETNWKEW